jgi:hypothetical protein
MDITIQREGNKNQKRPCGSRALAISYLSIRHSKLKPHRLGATLNRIICHGARICTRDKEIHNINALRLRYVEQRGVRWLTVRCLFAGVDWDDGAAVLHQGVRDAERRTFSIRGQPDDCPNRPEGIMNVSMRQMVQAS